MAKRRENVTSFSSPMTILSPITSRFYALRNYAGGLAQGSFLHLSRSACLSLLGKIKLGQLEILDCDGTRAICGRESAVKNEPQVTIRIHKEIFWVRLLLFADMVRKISCFGLLLGAYSYFQGFAESYLLSEVSCSNLTSFFMLFILNRSALSNGTTFTANLSSYVSGFLRATNTLTNSRLNTAAHYDISNTMFAAFLSSDMTYSCPIWLSKSNPHGETETLEEAQKRKLARFIKNVRLKPSDRVLEIGTGWGSFAIKAVRETGCHVTSLTLSKEQKELAEERIRDAGLESKIEVRLCDYRAMQMPEEGPFDKVVSIEMLEAVGREFLVTYFQCVDKLLKRDGGIAAFQCITIPEAVSNPIRTIPYTSIKTNGGVAEI